uniref:Uncharacterized protein n=2 Tax=Lotharella globosa TaxID=91324 RepID=A0A7S3YCT4_9EUKA|mmetsp:Transcript_26008/g.50884  ORF Transcript_26008/g.50884 Transcript_26008/m.50884 type:complete len:124 (+) Transcript_26008:183-554(+)
MSEEELLKALEKPNFKAKRKKKKKAERAAASARPVKPKRKLKPGEMAPWEEGQLFPEGWEEMDLGTKVANIYMGKRGLLFWLTQISLYVAAAVIVGWVVFRFVGPALGLYKLANGFDPESVAQ